MVQLCDSFQFDNLSIGTFCWYVDIEVCLPVIRSLEMYEKLVIWQWETIPGASV